MSVQRLDEGFDSAAIPCGGNERNALTATELTSRFAMPTLIPRFRHVAETSCEVPSRRQSGNRGGSIFANKFPSQRAETASPAAELVPGLGLLGRGGVHGQTNFFSL